MADPVTGLIVLGVAATTAKGVAQYSASQQKLQSLDLMQEQNVLRHQEKTLANFETSQKILDAQLSEATTRGIGLGSSSLEAIRRNTYNTESKRQSNLDIEESILERNTKAEKSNVKSTLYAELFGDVAGLTEDFALASAKIPTKG